MAMLPGPYIKSAPDGNTYFGILGPQRFLLSGYASLIRARTKYQSQGVRGRAQAAAIDALLQQVQSQVNRAAFQTAEYAESKIEQLIRQTQVRPDPPGPKTRLQDVITCRPITTHMPGGAVGIGDLTDLDRAADANGQVYWRSQEFGSHHLVGHVTYGHFQPGNSRPSPTQNRVHPIFKTGKGARLTVKAPISPRAFLREGAHDAAVYRQSLFTRISADAVQRVNAIATMTPGATGGGRRRGPRIR